MSTNNIETAKLELLHDLGYAKHEVRSHYISRSRRIMIVENIVIATDIDELKLMLDQPCHARWHYYFGHELSPNIRHIIDTMMDKPQGE